MPTNRQIKSEYESAKSLTNPIDQKPRSILAQMQFFTSFYTKLAEQILIILYQWQYPANFF